MLEQLDENTIEILKQKSPTERLEIANGLWRSACRILRSHLRQTHPDWTPEQFQAEIARRMSHEAV